MGLLTTLGISATQFKKQYPSDYKQVMDMFGGRGNISSVTAAIEIWHRNDPVPVCEICGKQVHISDKLIEASSGPHRCKSHGKRVKYYTADEIEDALPPHITIKRDVTPPLFPLARQLTFVCDKHGKYVQGAGYALKGGSCQKCYAEVVGDKFITPFSAWKETAIKAHNGKYDYTKTELEYKKSDQVVTINCPIHGDFHQNAGVHMRGYGCKRCANEELGKQCMSTTGQFIANAINVHGDKYTYDKVIYCGAKNTVIITCQKHGDFEQVANYHLSGNGCQICGFEVTNSISKSSAEYEIIEFLKSNGVKNICHSYRKLGFEIDIFLPDHTVGVEYDGIYWHSSNSIETDEKMSTQHLNKTEVCDRNGIQLFHIFENEWIDPVKKKIWQAILLRSIGNVAPYTDDLSLKFLVRDEAAAFFNENSLEDTIGDHNIGITCDDELVGVASFDTIDNANPHILTQCVMKKTVFIPNMIEIVVDEFAKSHSGKLISTINRRYDNDSIHVSAGFVIDKITNPCYHYVINGKVYNTSTELSMLISSYDDSLSPITNLYNNKHRRIWDCGYITFMKDI